MKRRIFSIVTAVFFLFSLIFSVTYITRFSRHEHISEENCAICLELQSLNERLHTPADGAACCDTAEFCHAPEESQEKGRARRARRGSVSTLVSLKVKLTN